MRPHPDPSSDLPAPLTAFIGRAREVDAVTKLIATHRLVTITGAGGVGKSRLALTVARHLTAATGGDVRWMELAPLGRGDLLAQHIATQLRVQEHPGRSTLEAIFETLRPPLRLVVLDNCEHVLEESAQFVSALLQRCGNVSVLATSRESLGIDGERSWLLRGLALDAVHDAVEPRDSEAVRLFADRARAVSRDFEITASNALAVQRICARLDGLPLAIELAAARVGVLAPEQIANRLDDAFALLANGSRSALPRHRTLRAAVDWSYELISAAERDLLQRLAVFSGAFSLEAAEHICGDDDLGADAVLELMASLVTRSLVTMHEESGSARYSLLEIIRQYAQELLAADEQRHRVLRRRHAEYYASLAVAALPRLERGAPASEAATLSLEYDNLRAALHWSFSSGERELGVRLAGALWRYWGLTWQLSEAEHWWKEVLAGPEPAESGDLGQALNGAGTFMYVTGDTARALALLGRAAEVLERAGDRTHEAMARSTMAHICCTLRRFDEAFGHAEKAVAIARELPAAWPLCNAMGNGLALVHDAVGRHDLAEACVEEALEKARRTGADPWGVATVARAGAQLALDRGRLEDARRRALTAIAAVQTFLDPHLSMRVLLLGARLLHRLGQSIAAAEACGAIAAAQSGGMLILAEDLRAHDALMASLPAALGEAALSKAAATGAARDTGEALAAAAAQMTSAGHTPPAPSAPASAATGSAAYALRVRALGSVEVVMGDDTRVLEGPSHSRCAELLVYLLAHPEGQPRDLIGLAFWPDASPLQVKNNFHVLLHKLRKALGRHDIVVATGQSYRINPAVRVWFDAREFEGELSRSLRARRSAASAARLEAALALYRGDFLERRAGGEWLGEHRDRLQVLYAEGLSALADLQIGNGAFEAATATLERLVRADDLDEASWRRLMTCLERTGQRDLALRHYRSLVRRLRVQLDAEPEPATQALARRLSGSAPQ